MIDIQKDIMCDYTLEKHLSVLCGINAGYEVLIDTWNLSKKYFEGILVGTTQAFPTFSKHDITHSYEIINKISRLLGEKRIKQLSPTDTWLILQSALLHDWGMVIIGTDVENELVKNNFTFFLKEKLLGNDRNLKVAASAILDLKEFISQKEPSALQAWNLKKHLTLLISEYFRKNHGTRTASYILENIRKDLNIGSSLIHDRIFANLAEIIACHDNDFSEIMKLEKVQAGHKLDNFHPRFIASLLRIGDLLDMENNRFNKNVYSFLFPELPEVSEAHRQKHLSLKNMYIDEEQIQIVVDCKNPVIYREAKAWLSWLDEDLKNLASNWGKIVPCYFIGYLPFVAEQRVLINGKDTGSLQSAFDRKDIYKLLKGNSLYENPLTFVRELLQNALDATKIQIYRDIKFGLYPNLLTKKLDHLSPFDLADIFKLYPIEIKIEPCIETKKVLFSISDRGTGIDKESLRYLAEISKSYSQREQRREEILEMPKWLRPTGGFGVGLQSAFSVTDEVRIKTRTEQTGNSFEITLYSFDKGGYINVMDIADIKKQHRFRGSIVELSFDVNIDLSYSRYFSYRYYKEKDSFCFDIMSKAYRTKIVEIKNYIEEMFKNSYIQIKVNNENLPINEFLCSRFDENVLPFRINRQYGDFEEHDNFETSSKLSARIKAADDLPIEISQEDRDRDFDEQYENYLLNQADRHFYGSSNGYNFLVFDFWDKDYNAQCTLEIGSHNGSNSYFYKGCEINTVVDNPLSCCHINVKFDIYGFPVDECLKITRDDFNNNFKQMEMANLTSSVLKNTITCLVNEMKNKKEFEEHCFKVFLACVILKLDYKPILQNISSEASVDALRIDYSNSEKPIASSRKISCSKLASDIDNGKPIRYLDKYNSFREENYLLENYPNFIEKILKEHKDDPSTASYIDIVCDSSLDSIFRRNFNVEKLILNTDSEFDYLGITEPTQLIVFSNASLNGKLYIEPTSEKSKLKWIEKMVRKIHHTTSSYAYLYAITGFEKLSIKCLPEEFIYSDMYRYRAVIIAPITSQQLENIGHYDTVENFITYITEQPQFNSLIEYIIKNQNKTDFYSKKEVKDEYERLIRELYMQVQSEKQGILPLNWK